MGSKKSESKSTTAVTTNTTTEIGDIGLTGAQLVQAVAIFESATLERERLLTERLDSQLGRTVEPVQAGIAVVMVIAAIVGFQALQRMRRR